MVTAVYIHIPFCEKICHYCDFTKFFYREKMADDYLVALEKEMQYYLTSSKQKMKTIYVGGGTPTALNVAQLERLLKMIDAQFLINETIEYTFEANPGDLTVEKIKLLKDYGVNRISMGVQVFDDALLQFLGRLHRVKDVGENIKNLKTYGIDNISIDLMYGLPNQTLKSFSDTLDYALSFDLPHYSSYCLQIEPKTVFYQRYMQKKLVKPPEELEANMFTLLQEKMRQKGYLQYEVSNFSKPGYASRHNLTYWDNLYYYGFGAGASGYLKGERYINNKPLNAYLKAVETASHAVLYRDQISKKAEIEEQMFLNLRKTEGADRLTFKNRFGFDFDVLYQEIILDLVEKGYLVNTPETIYMTETGQLFGNTVFQAFLLPEDLKVQEIEKKT